MIANAHEYEKAQEELTYLAMWLSRLEEKSPLPAKGLTRASVLKMIARLQEEMAIFSGAREMDPWQSIRNSLVAGCSEQEFDAMRCPICAERLRLAVRPNGQEFHVCCQRDTTHVSMHDHSDVSPDWWQNHKTSGWY